MLVLRVRWRDVPALCFALVVWSCNGGCDDGGLTPASDSGAQAPEAGELIGARPHTFPFGRDAGGAPLDGSQVVLLVVLDGGQSSVPGVPDAAADAGDAGAAGAGADAAPEGGQPDAAGAPPANACGGTAVLEAAPGTFCPGVYVGVCSDGKDCAVQAEWECSGTQAVRCACNCPPV